MQGKVAGISGFFRLRHFCLVYKTLDSILLTKGGSIKENSIVFDRNANHIFAVPDTKPTRRLSSKTKTTDRLWITDNIAIKRLIF